ncbi:S1-C subfamily serine protease [Bradyrhizobium japonicum]|jgi:S1-C subfamily serine protease|uniref:S1-C subfamily serine protease n=1 Tax=Bradyrhizobium elkanii TaxID=29448 RepID=A0ABV4ES57_BRAEL|nr:S1C family serine protease [Bradyrhizobium elkanii]MBP2429582.1 S1-C subfamily serine protease [Bradyrhizobium elkanii]MCP1736946.1 S1-C subfamily serine protease [Bradyrhizobium elkanii]MCP1754991.1 S1-C subfamily serine protease [Bradyrhizobium elkanii]MCP1980509.1 S1-C subfamily serine protease [Bradyrhizobium elkanii]MCS3572286.1 S1-C subfamily serine protease [Bradyrhizobium elkanii]
MPSATEWKVPAAFQPRPEDYRYDLDRALMSVVGLHSIIPPDAFSAETLGTERAGNGVLIDDGLVLTIGYLITEAATVWLHLGDGRAVEGHALGFDFESGFGLVQALGRLDLEPLRIGSSAATQVGDNVVLGGAGGRTRSVASQIAAKQEFAGYWEYLLDEAIFTSPSHPNWGGTGLINNAGELIGIGSLQLERERSGHAEHVNMIVPIDLLNPVLDDLRKYGRVDKPARPWLGMYTTEIDNRLVVVGVASKGPAARAELKTGDVILAVDGDKVTSQAGFYRKLWSLGAAGVDVPLTIYHEGVTFDVTLTSIDRMKLLKAPRLH